MSCSRRSFNTTSTPLGRPYKGSHAFFSQLLPDGHKTLGRHVSVRKTGTRAILVVSSPRSVVLRLSNLPFGTCHHDLCHLRPRTLIGTVFAGPGVIVGTEGGSTVRIRPFKPMTERGIAFRLKPVMQILNSSNSSPNPGDLEPCEDCLLHWSPDRSFESNRCFGSTQVGWSRLVGW